MAIPSKRITIIQGHPNPDGQRFGHALAQAYAEGCKEAGHEVRHIAVALLDFPLLHSKQEWDAECPPDIVQSQQAIGWADHLVIIYPLWLGAMPALLKGFFEQVFRPDFAIRRAPAGTVWKKLLKGKSARIVVTMGMPAFIYRWFYGAHSLRSLERNILGFVGIRPVRSSIIGMVEAGDGSHRTTWLARMQELGRQAR